MTVAAFSLYGLARHDSTDGHRAKQTCTFVLRKVTIDITHGTIFICIYFRFSSTIYLTLSLYITIDKRRRTNAKNITQ